MLKTHFKIVMGGRGGQSGGREEIFVAFLAVFPYNGSGDEK